jgi:hypothetical protein
LLHLRILLASFYGGTPRSLSEACLEVCTSIRPMILADGLFIDSGRLMEVIESAKVDGLSMYRYLCAKLTALLIIGDALIARCIVLILVPIPCILCACSQANIFCAIIKSIAVDVIDLQPVRGTEDLAVHVYESSADLTGGVPFASCSVTSGLPTELAQIGKPFVIH